MTESNISNFQTNDQCKADAEKKACTMGGDLLTNKSSNDILRQHSSTNDRSLSFLPSYDQLLPPEQQVCKAPTHEKRGLLDLTIDESGELIEVKDNRGNTFTKGSDGKWTDTLKIDDLTDVSKCENVQVDCDGKLTYDVNNGDWHVHHEYNADGSWRMTSDKGSYLYDDKLQLVEAPAGEGFQRKFHYDQDGHVDQIDGRLGHWDRKVDPVTGESSWVNKDTGAVWDGDFKVTADQLEYRGHNGTAWAFTRQGEDVQLPAEK